MAISSSLLSNFLFWSHVCIWHADNDRMISFLYVVNEIYTNFMERTASSCSPRTHAGHGSQVVSYKKLFSTDGTAFQPHAISFESVNSIFKKKNGQKKGLITDLYKIYDKTVLYLVLLPNSNPVCGVRTYVLPSQEIRSRAL